MAMVDQDGWMETGRMNDEGREGEAQRRLAMDVYIELLVGTHFMLFLINSWTISIVYLFKLITIKNSVIKL